MRIHCKHCQQAITGSLYLKSKHDRRVVDWFSDAGESVHYDLKLTVPKGAMVKLRMSRYYGDDFPAICVDRESLLIPYPKYESGMGCCDVDGEEVNCTCGVLLGIMRYDCWQTGNYVNLDGNSAELRNNSHNVRRDVIGHMLKGVSWYIRRKSTLVKLHKSNLVKAKKTVDYEWTEEYSEHTDINTEER